MSRESGAIQLDYFIGPNGIEPKLKYQLTGSDPVTGADLSLETLVERILLGPSVATGMGVHGICRMLEKTRHPDLVRRLSASSTPYRATS